MIEIKIPEGEHCEGCHFVRMKRVYSWTEVYCCLWNTKLEIESTYGGFSSAKCDQCKNKEQIEIKYEE